MNKHLSSYFLIVGLGASGMSMAGFLHSKGEKVIATDIDPSKKDQAGILSKMGIDSQIGFHDQDVFDHADVIVPSPGIPLNSRYIQTALAKGVKLTGELDIFSRYNDIPVIAITGTNGKTTVTSLIGEIVKACGVKPFVGGNIGTPLVEHLMSDNKADIIVAEVSSFQLDLSKKFKPDVAVLLNITPDHLDRYENYDAYRKSKYSIFQNQSADDVSVVNLHLEDFHPDAVKSKTAGFAAKSLCHPLCYASISTDRIDFRHIGDEKMPEKFSHCIQKDHLRFLPGNHNMENAAAAVLASMSGLIKLKHTVRFADIVKAVSDFRLLPHRMEFVSSFKGISFYNDSKATNTDAAAKAIECFDGNLILILGGRAKNTDFSELCTYVKKGVRSIIALGETRPEIKEVFHAVCPVISAFSMKDAVEKAFAQAGTGDVVLLSPGCASFDLYENYKERGNDFIRCVKKLEAREIAELSI